VRPEVELTLVGYGVSGDDGAGLGIKRSTVAEVGLVGREIVVGDDEHGACAGDSGGPAFVSLLGADHRVEWALAGILSSGVEGTTCGTGYYTDLSRVIDWLEAAVASDLTPCFEGSEWHPTEHCLRAMVDDQGLPIADGRPLVRIEEVVVGVIVDAAFGGRGRGTRPFGSRVREPPAAGIVIEQTTP